MSLKAELTTFLAKKVKELGQVLRRQLVVAWGKECEATHKDMGHLQSDHEEVDTKIILHAVDATADGATDLSGLGFCARTCVAVLTTVNARTSMTTTSISMMRTKVMKTSVVMSEGLRNDSKNVYVSLSGILKKTINFHETLPQESEFLSKCRHYWRIKFGLFFMSASCCL